MRPAPALLLAALTATTLAGCSPGDAMVENLPPTSVAVPGPGVTADLLAPDGSKRGSATLSFDGDAAVIDVKATGLTPGPHGFHVHKTGKCEPKSPDPADPTKTGDFLSAGGHLAADGQVHGDHDGDLPPLLVAADGTASLTFATDRVAVEDVLDEDGTAVMVHADRDNFASIPERYAPQGPDETTAKTGDAGARVACAALTEAG